MEKIKFQKPDPDYEFQQGDEIYVIDKNRHDIWAATIRKISSKGYFVHYESDHEDRKYPGTNRFLLRCPHNNAIFEAQEKERKAIENGDKSNEQEEKEVQAAEIINQEKKPETGNPTTKPSKPATRKKIQKESDEDDEEPELEDDEKDEDVSNQSNSEQSSNHNSQPEPPSKKKKKIRSHKSTFDVPLLVLNAWDNGIQDVDTFKQYINEQMDQSISSFEQLHKMQNLKTSHPFKLGGPIDHQTTDNFFAQAQILWKKMFGDRVVVPINEFLKNASKTLKLPNQLESNAHQTLKFVFDPEDTKQYIDLVQFCSFLAMFGPHQTAFRKVGQLLNKSPIKVRNSILFPDIPGVFEELGPEAEMNCFTLKLANNESQATTQESQEDNDLYVYNLPLVNTDSDYLIDHEGTTYHNWMDFCEKNADNVATIEGTAENEED